jgi:hypothetical protein
MGCSGNTPCPCSSTHLFHSLISVLHRQTIGISQRIGRDAWGIQYECIGCVYRCPNWEPPYIYFLCCYELLLSSLHISNEDHIGILCWIFHASEYANIAFIRDRESAHCRFWRLPSAHRRDNHEGSHGKIHSLPFSLSSLLLLLVSSLHLISVSFATHRSRDNSSSFSSSFHPKPSRQTEKIIKDRDRIAFQQLTGLFI